MDTVLPVLHADDDEDIRGQMAWRLKKFGIPMVGFQTNEEALRAVQEGGHYSGVVVDYDTRSHLTGATLIAQLALMTECDEPLLLSSSASRQKLENELESARQALIDSGSVTDFAITTRLDKIDIFDKGTEAELAVVFIAMKRYIPESRELRRKDLIVHLLGSSFEGNDVPGYKFERYLNRLGDVVS